MTNVRPMASRLRQLALRVLQIILPPGMLRTQERVQTATVYLTFDDGPTPDTTPAILDVLQRHRARATFFVVGRQAAQHPDLVRRMIAEGHVVGGHTFHHRPPREVDAGQLWTEILQTDETLQSIVGQAPRLFRPPYGKLTARKLWRLLAAGRSIVLWNKDPRDFAASTPQQIVEWFDLHPCRDGDIVLLHDTSHSTAQALDSVLTKLDAAGLVPRSLNA